MQKWNYNFLRFPFFSLTLEFHGAQRETIEHICDQRLLLNVVGLNIDEKPTHQRGDGRYLVARFMP